jgi:hypothetical protein
MMDLDGTIRPLTALTGGLVSTEGDEFDLIVVMGWIGKRVDEWLQIVI